MIFDSPRPALDAEARLQGGEKDYEELLLSELALAFMAEDSKSVRELGISKTVIENLRSGDQTDMKLSNFVKLIHVYGFHIVLEKEGHPITSQCPASNPIQCAGSRLTTSRRHVFARPGQPWFFWNQSLIRRRR
jgi:hypothetical protein